MVPGEAGHPSARLMMIVTPCVWCQVGIVSFGPAPCDATIPGVYTRVAAYRQWMEDTVAMHGGW